LGGPGGVAIPPEWPQYIENTWGGDIFPWPAFFFVNDDLNFIK